MKRKLWILSLIMLFMLAACNYPSAKGGPAGQGQTLDEDVVATAVQKTLEAEAVDVDQPEENPTEEVSDLTATPEPPTETPEPTATSTETPTLEPTETAMPTPTLSNDDPVTLLGNATWTAEFNNDKEGFYDGDDEHTVIEVQNDALTFTSTMTIKGWHTWSLNYRTVQNAYFEAEIDVKQCNGTDEYGLVFRGPDYVNGYFFAARCNGEYSLRTYDGEYEFVAGWQYSDKLNAGPNQRNRIGVRMDGSDLKLYINGELVDTVTDDKFTDAGHFGFFSAAYETPGLRIEVDRARYWNLN